MGSSVLSWLIHERTSKHMAGIHVPEIHAEKAKQLGDHPADKLNWQQTSPPRPDLLPPLWGWELFRILYRSEHVLHKQKAHSRVAGPDAPAVHLSVAAGVLPTWCDTLPAGTRAPPHRPVPRFT